MAILSWRQFIRYLWLLFPLMFNYKVFGILRFVNFGFNFSNLHSWIISWKVCCAECLKIDAMDFFFFSTSMMHSSINRRQACRLRCKLIRRTPCHTLLIIVCSSTP